MKIFETNNAIYSLENTLRIEYEEIKRNVYDPYDSNKGIITIIYKDHTKQIIRFESPEEALNAKATIAAILRQK